MDEMAEKESIFGKQMGEQFTPLVLSRRVREADPWLLYISGYGAQGANPLHPAQQFSKISAWNRGS